MGVSGSLKEYQEDSGAFKGISRTFQAFLRVSEGFSGAFYRGLRTFDVGFRDFSVDDTYDPGFP